MENSTRTDSSPVILAMDTSAGKSSVALWQNGIIAAMQDDVPGQQSRTLVPMVEAVLAQAGKSYSDCDMLACALGPGGFTSVRVGVAAARAMALAAEKPLVGVNSLEVIAFASGVKGDVLAVIDAHRQQFYAQRFRLNGIPHAQSEALLVEESSLKALGHGAKRADATFTAEHVAQLAHAQWQGGKREFPNEPLYIREPDAKLPATN